MSVTTTKSAVQRRSPSLAAVLAAAVALPLAARALVHPALLYDDWYYHLPFAAALAGMGGDFHWSDLIEGRWQGFPRFWEFVIAAVWKATGGLRFIVAPQVALTAAYFVGMALELGVPLSWMALAFSACPLLLIHSYVAYNDLPAGLALAGAAALALRLKPAAPGRLALISAGLAIAGNIKFQGFIAAAAVGGLLLTFALWRRQPRLALAILLGLALASASLVRNEIAHANPFYPIEVRALGRVIFTGPESPDFDADYPAYARPGGGEMQLPEPINFLLSATELDFPLRGVPFGYNVDQVAGLSPARGAPARTGGWGAAFALANAFAFVLQWRRRRNLDDQQRILLFAATGIVLLAALLPRAHELRYWLFAPLIVSAVNLRWLATWRRRDLAEAALMALAAVSVGLCAASPKSELLRFRAIDPARLAAQRPAATVEALEKTGRFCDSDDPTLFIASRAATGAPGLVSMRPEDCR